MADFAIVPRYVRANPDISNIVPIPPAPRVPAGPHSLAAKVSGPAGWTAAVADYLAKKAFSDALSMDDEDESDAAVDAYCDALDHLIEHVRAPSLDALAYKIGLAQDRWEHAIFPNEALTAFIADARALAAGDC